MPVAAWPEAPGLDYVCLGQEPGEAGDVLDTPCWGPVVVIDRTGIWAAVKPVEPETTAVAA